jgi:hypothetical protein
VNSVVFRTGGDWDTTTLHNNGQEVFASQLLVELHCGRDAWGNPMDGGIGNGGEFTAIIRPQDNPGHEVGIFPGRLEMDFPHHSLLVENVHPGFGFEFTRVWYNGHDITDDVVDLLVNVDAVNNVVQAFVTVYRSHWIARDEVATYTII